MLVNYNCHPELDSGSCIGLQLSKIPDQVRNDKQHLLVHYRLIEILSKLSKMSKFIQSVIIEVSAKLEWDELVFFLKENKIISEDDRIDKSLSTEITLEEGKSSIGIKEVEELAQWNSRKSENIKIVVIRNAEKLTTQAQNSLLKIIEEPNLNNLIVLETINIKSLLETIRSRCKKFRLNSDKISKFDSISFDLKQYLRSTYSQRKELINSAIKDVNKNDFLEYFIGKLMTYFVEQKELFDKDTFGDMVELMEYSYLGNKRGINFKLLVDYLNFNLIQIK